jgi:hypothetical protein
MALGDIRGKAAGLPLAELLGGVLRPEVEVAACMGIAAYDRARELAAYYVEQGFSALKTQAGASIDEDLEMVRGIRTPSVTAAVASIPTAATRRHRPTWRVTEPPAGYLEQPLRRPLADAAWLQTRQAHRSP